ncbi:hypothetical protein [Thermococcus sp. JCM 11816]|uniref:hypothetical protein n=1 Tax=Thermococcus sp. (strain JCM 11816 / KS-1) TaxID=1295125 RepID=UPI000AAB6B7E
MLAGLLLWIAIDSYHKIEGAEYIVTHYSGEDAIKEAMELAKDARNTSIETWALLGGFCFAVTFFIGGFLGISAVGLGNLANFIMIFIAHSRYNELRKALLLLQVTEKGNAEIAVKL